MRLVGFYLRSRHVHHALTYVAGVALLGWAGASMLLMQPYGEMPDVVLVPVLLFAPLATACVIGVSTHSPFGDLERTSARSLPALRFLHLAALLAWGALALSLAAITWGLPQADLLLARNLLGLAGLSFLTACWFGGGLSWAVPLVYVVLVQLTGRSPDGSLAFWAWPMQPVDDELSWVLALTLFAAGLAAVCVFGARHSSEEFLR